MAKNFYQQYIQLKHEVTEAIYKMVDEHGGRILVPYYYLDDDVDDDVEQLIEDGFDVRNGDGDNLTVLVETGTTLGFVEIVAVKTGKGIVLITKDSNLYNFQDIATLPGMIAVYDHLVNMQI